MEDFGRGDFVCNLGRAWLPRADFTGEKIPPGEIRQWTYCVNLLIADAFDRYNPGDGSPHIL